MKKFLILFALCVFAGSATAAGDAAAGKAKAAACTACHGADGNSANPAWPSLAGQHEAYIAKQLQDFKDGTRENALMAPNAAGLSAADMADIGAWYASQTATGGAADPALVEAGQKMYQAGNAATGVAACMACHGPTGTGNPAANFPRLAGQHADYTAAQLKAFADGQRANDAGSMMRMVAAKMSDAEMRAVASYIQGLQ